MPERRRANWSPSPEIKNYYLSTTVLNYLSHYYCEYPEDRPYYVLGLILPDLLRELEPRKIRFLPEELQDSENDNFTQLNRGILRHLEVDGAFHTSEFFHRNVEQIKQWLLLHTYVSIPSRIPVFAHVLLELMLDRVIIKRDPNSMECFYAALEQVEEAVVVSFFQQNGIVQRPQAVYQRVRYFCKDRFLYRYPGNDMMLYALNVLNQKVGQSVIAAEDELLLLETIERTELLLNGDALTIFDELRPT